MQSWQDCSTPWWRIREDPHCPHSLFGLGCLKTKQLKEEKMLPVLSRDMTCITFGVVHNDHLFQRWCDQQVVGHWAVSKSWPHEGRGHWTPQHPTLLGALYKTHVNMRDETMAPLQVAFKCIWGDLIIRGQCETEFSQYWARQTLQTLHFIPCKEQNAITEVLSSDSPFWDFCRWSKLLVCVNTWMKRQISQFPSQFHLHVMKRSEKGCSPYFW